MVFSRIGLGTVQFGLDYGISNTIGKTPEAEVTSILNYMRSKGMRVIDTAMAYGESEEVLGKNNLNDVLIVTKFMPPGEGESIRNLLFNSLNKLQRKSIYGLLAHRPLELLKNKADWEILGLLKENGTIAARGFSVDRPEELEILLAAGLVPDLVQLPYNYMDRRFEKSIVDLKKIGCLVHVRSVFLQGLFFSKVGNLPEFFSNVKETILCLQNDFRGTLPSALLRFVLQNSGVDCAILGVENKEQLMLILENLDHSLELPQLHLELDERILMPRNWPAV
jgi:aryl-alcohol dehydrogenase-like predicted oxidoreductase